MSASSPELEMDPGIQKEYDYYAKFLEPGADGALLRGLRINLAQLTTALRDMAAQEQCPEKFRSSPRAIRDTLTGFDVPAHPEIWWQHYRPTVQLGVRRLEALLQKYDDAIRNA